MPSFIGNNIAFNGRGVVGADLILPDEYDYLGNGSSLFSKVLHFSLGNHARASDAYILAKNPDSGLFEMSTVGSNVLATRNIGGEIGGLFESAFATKNTYSEVFRDAISNWTNVRIDVTDDSINDPLGNTTVDFLKLTTDNNTHYIQQVLGNSDGESKYYSVFFAKAGGYKYIRNRMGSGPFPGSPEVIFNVDAGSIHSQSDVDDYGVLELSNGLFCCYCAAISDAIDVLNIPLMIYDNDGVSSSFAGDGTSGLYFWGAYYIKANHWTNYIKAVSAVAEKPTDYFYWDSSVIPTWFKDEFTVRMIPNYDYPSQINFDKPIWSFQKSSQTVSSVNGYRSLRLDPSETYWYWVDRSAGKIMRCDLDFDNITTLISGLSSPYAVTPDSSNLFVVDNGAGTIIKYDLDGTNPVTLASGLSSPQGCATKDGDSYLYYSDSTDTKIAKFLKADGTGGSDVVTGITVRGMFLDTDDYIYFGGGSVVRRIPKAGGSVETLVSGISGAFDVTTDNKNHVFYGAYGTDIIGVINKTSGISFTLKDETGGFSVCRYKDRIAYTNTSGYLKYVDHVTAYLATNGKIKVIDGPDTKVETDALSCDMHDEVTIEFNRDDGEIKTEGFTGDDTFAGSSWTSPDGYDVEYGCALKGAASSDAILFEPKA